MKCASKGRIPALLVKDKFFWDAIRALILAVFLYTEATKLFVVYTN